MRVIYSFLTYLIAPLLPIYLKKRGIKNPAYLLNWNERFSVGIKNPTTKPILWIHGVSVGETRSVQKLVSLINKQLLEYQILFTTMTPTGRIEAKKLYPFAIVHYIPYDLSICVKKFFKVFNPQLGIIIDTEIWPNLTHYANKNLIPLLLINARLSEKSFINYYRFKWFIKSVINNFFAILCQNKATYKRFLKLGFKNKILMVGSTKFDLIIEEGFNDKLNQFKNLLASHKEIILISSSREKEEELILNHLQLKANYLYIIVPRHPERFNKVEEILINKKISYQKRSDYKSIMPNTQVLLGDSMGEMLLYSSVSKLAIIGGSFLNYGGQSPLEALHFQVPVVFGPFMYNFNQIAQDIIKFKCGVQVSEIQELNSAINLVLDLENYTDYQTNAEKFIDHYAGASDKILNLICEVV